MKITCVGAGPAGLYLAILLKSRDPGHEITVYEQNSPGVTQGWGVVYWDDLISDLEENDPESAREIVEQSFRWVDQLVEIKGCDPVHEIGGGYSMGRKRLLDILARRATALGVTIHYETELDAPAESLPDSDVVVASDGVGSRLRRRYSHEFGTRAAPGRNKYVWLGTTRVFRTFQFAFVPTEAGWIWFHAYGFDESTSTLIVECSPETWTGLGLDRLDAEQGLARLEEIFADHLAGHRLLVQARDGRLPWLSFLHVTNERWYRENVVLVGDAAHTAHFSIGSGTRLALEDTIALARHLGERPDVRSALQAYETERKLALVRPQKDASFSARWYENVARYAVLEPAQFSAVMRQRRSPVVAMLPPRLYCRFDGLTRNAAVLHGVRRRAAHLYRRAAG